MKTDYLSEQTMDMAVKHINDILSLAIMHSAEHAAVVVFDSLSPLATALTEAYRRCLPTATFIDFYAVSPAEVHAAFEKLVPSDLVVLIQSTSFRLDAFRLRVELFKNSLKVIEHPHLATMSGVEQIYYLESLAYDPVYYRGLGHELKRLIDQAGGGVINSGGAELIFGSSFEPAKLNIGDYTNMNNIGGQFPIGEVFTEAVGSGIGPWAGAHFCICRYFLFS